MFVSVIIHFLPHRHKQAIVQLQFSQIRQIGTYGNRIKNRFADLAVKETSDNYKLKHLILHAFLTCFCQICAGPLLRKLMRLFHSKIFHPLHFCKVYLLSAQLPNYSSWNPSLTILIEHLSRQTTETGLMGDYFLWSDAQTLLTIK